MRHLHTPCCVDDKTTLRRNPPCTVFPPAEAKLIATTVERDLRYYDATISEAAVAGLTRFAAAIGLPCGKPAFEDIVALQFRELGKQWHKQVAGLKSHL